MTVAEVQREKTAVGLYPGLSRASYEAIQAVNVSSLTEFERTPAHARAAALHPPRPTEAMDFGTALHCAILEPQRFMCDYAVGPQGDRRTKAAKEAWAAFEAEHPNAIVLDADDFNNIQRMRDSVWRHPVAKQLLGGIGHNEVGIVFDLTFENMEGDETTIRGKSLLDRISQYADWSWIVDLKSCLDASKRQFTKAIKNLHYGAKAAYYLDGANAAAPRARRFTWIAIEKTPPCAVALYEPDDDALAAGRAKYSRWLRLREEAIRLNRWDGYPVDIQPLGAHETEWSQ